MGLRCWYFSGYGLGDDIIIRHATAWFLESGNAPGANYAYRFVWWVPTVVSAALLGVTEAGLLTPILLAATLSFPLVYALGKAFWDRPGGVVASLLLVVIPIDFAWATMMTPDIISSGLVGGAMLCLLRASVLQTTRARRGLLALAALLAWLSFYVKVSVGLMGVPILALLWMHRHVLGRDVLVFFVMSVVLFGASTYVTFSLTGDPLHPLTSEVSAQGLTGKEAAIWHPVNRYVFMHFPKAVFGFDAYGHALFGGLANLLVVLALLGPLLGLRPRAPELWWWVLVLALGMQFNFQRAEGVWVAGFRNVRHLHGIAYPLVLLVAGYLVGLRARSRRTFAVALIAVLAFGLWHSTETAMLTRVSFADRRAA
jgi:4-amino-4-deoxy-L-arabinose transferase-like glycosyltransferase